MSPIRKPNMSFLQGVDLAKKSDYQTWMFAAAGLSLLFIAVYSVFSVVETIIEEERYEEVHLPNFAAITSTKERKQAFFDFLEPFVVEANGDILEERAEVLKLQAYFERNQRLSGSRLESFNQLRESYKLDPVDSASAQSFRELLNRVDTIPVSLALAQAAIESGWGTSRFARQGNNLFGMWCYEPGCGLVPKRRSPGKTHEVTVYRSPRESFLAYLRNLNTGPAYGALRDIRASHRENGVEPSGRDLAPGLVRYSQERWTYVDKVRGMIAANRLDSR
ncbi:glucosaminidase domain-containing protein [Pelagicoccus sp. NFK12]|uniref:Glucosaminidase domain-containing protein n=1 Tax=Pelagicoccus enzymogenes TaxID=2773457 RepID=A0A927IK86_9BACT|nr:glucosaminidase domain-containing protein [Pelagicoccus enzymogenes]MBD5782355.1 glucosaminidase domain-containing protein [Pelagicoccus enzymogenes]